VALEWKHSTEGVDWDELSALYRAAPLSDKKPALLQTVFSNSMFTCFVYDDARLVGAGRALADGGDCAYLCDVAVLPSHQGTGLGKQIVAHPRRAVARPPQDHSLRGAGQGALLPEVRLPAHEDGDGDLRQPAATARARLSQRGLSRATRGGRDAEHRGRTVDLQAQHATPGV
jgi:GNAT superfamily N-acetyltransferase